MLVPGRVASQLGQASGSRPPAGEHGRGHRGGEGAEHPAGVAGRWAGTEPPSRHTDPSGSRPALSPALRWGRVSVPEAVSETPDPVTDVLTVEWAED